MLDQELINKVRIIKQERGYTLFELSRIIDVQISTIERWLKTARINKIYARLVRERLEIQ